MKEKRSKISRQDELEDVVNCDLEESLFNILRQDELNRDVANNLLEENGFKRRGIKRYAKWIKRKIFFLAI